MEDINEAKDRIRGERKVAMKLYLLTQDVATGYDTYDSAVVAAKDEAEARLVEVGSYGECWSPWAAPEFVKAEYLGEAKEGVGKGVILASFNAG